MTHTIAAKFDLNRKDGSPFAKVFIGATVIFSEDEKGKLRFEEYDKNQMSIDVCHPIYLEPISLYSILKFECDEKISILESGLIDQAIERAATQLAEKEYQEKIDREELEFARKDKRYAQQHKQPD